MPKTEATTAPVHVGGCTLKGIQNRGQNYSCLCCWWYPIITDTQNRGPIHSCLCCWLYHDSCPKKVKIAHLCCWLQHKLNRCPKLGTKLHRFMLLFLMIQFMILMPPSLISVFGCGDSLQNDWTSSRRVK